MGGVISLQSKSAEGSIFSFSLTFPQGDPIDSRAEPVSPLLKMKVLVVDDNATNLYYLKKTLTGWGAECYIYSSAEEALAYLNQSTESGLQLDLAIIDFTMSEMDGVALATCIRRDKNVYKLPLILMSTIYQENIEGCFDEVIIKPIREKALLSNIVHTVDKQIGVRDEFSTQNRSDVMGDKMLNGVTVLLVEDNFANQKVALAMLKHLGASVVVANNGEEAVEKFWVCSPTVVLMDCQMPGMDGFKATKMIRAMEKERELTEIPIIALTANAMQDDRQRCLDSGMNDYLTKPIEYSLLSEAIINSLQSAPNTLSINEERGAVEAEHNSTENLQLDEVGSGIDYEALSNLKNICKDASLYEQIISIYLVESKNLMRGLERAYQTDDRPLVAEIAHSLKSSSRNVGANALGQLLENLELRAKNNIWDAADAVYSAIGEEYKVVVELLEL